jgi:hypothetical protein
MSTRLPLHSTMWQEPVTVRSAPWKEIFMGPFVRPVVV